MCGLAGLLAFGPTPFTTQSLATMSKSLRHRGPDDSGAFLDKTAGVAFMHRRLSIIDLSEASHQPMVDAASGVVLAFNGEIYNFRVLREQLASLGHTFRTQGDTEVLLRSYLQWGMDCVQHLNGMFAFALWDPRSGVVHLARDAMGMKPLYIAHLPQGLAFASEVKAFRAVPGFAMELDPHGVTQFLEFGYIFDGNGTSLRNVQKVLPGERIAIRDGAIVERVQWFTPPAPTGEPAGSLVERTEQLRAVLEEVVQQHLIADVPIGLLLSGGLDSSVIAALAARHQPITTICMGFAGSDVDERAHAAKVAAHIGSQHHEVLIAPEDVKREIASGAWVIDDLFADWGTISTRLLYRRCRAMGIRAVLVGEGSDELFGGYDVFHQPPRLGPSAIFRLYQRYCGRRWGRLFGTFRNAMREYLAAGAGDTFHAIRLFESRRQLPNNYVMKVDKGSMAESVEARAPYLDRRVAEFAYAIPREHLLAAGENKHILRQVARMHNLLPLEIAGRRKFGAPLAASWMDTDQEFRAFAREAVLDAHGQTAALGLRHAMTEYFDRGRAGQRWPGPISIYSNLAWRLLLLELWSRHYLGSAEGAEHAR